MVISCFGCVLSSVGACPFFSIGLVNIYSIFVIFKYQKHNFFEAFFYNSWKNQPRNLISKSGFNRLQFSINISEKSLVLVSVIFVVFQKTDRDSDGRSSLQPGCPTRFRPPYEPGIIGSALKAGSKPRIKSIRWFC